MKKKVALITGASAGIGAELSKKYAQDGFIVCLLARSKAPLEALSVQINSKNQRAYVYVCDVTKKSDIEITIKKIIETFGQINLVICNAGGTRTIKETYSSDNIIENFALNVFSLTHMIELTLPHLKAQANQNQRSQLVYISSNAAYLPLSYLGVYSATKKASEYLLEALRRELSDTKVHITIVSPGYIKTALTSYNTFPMPGLMSLEKGSRLIYTAIKHQKKYVAFPTYIVLLLKILAVFPTHWSLKLLGKRQLKKSTTPVHKWD